MYRSSNILRYRDNEWLNFTVNRKAQPVWLDLSVYATKRA